MPICEYRYHKGNIDFKCTEPVHSQEWTRCIFHDTNYLKAKRDSVNYHHKKQVAKRFEDKLLEYSSRNMPLKFIGYCLPDISFKNKEFKQTLYFNDATFYERADC